MTMLRRRRTLILAGGVLAAAAIAGAVVLASDEPGDVTACRGGGSTTVPQPTCGELSAAGLAKLPLAPSSSRVDLGSPPFSHSTRIDNPLFPISELHSAILNGVVDGQTFKVETTLLPKTRLIGWGEGRCVETLASQYVAYLDDRLEEVAIDHYAQADDGSVWYLGEDVFNYEDGVVADRLGTWIAGRDGPGAMIMPAAPKVRDAYRPENIPGFVFEEVTVNMVDKTVAGPRGPVRGAIEIRELHADGAFESKDFAPGYGEFFTASGGDVEALALAVPTDALEGGVPSKLAAVSAGADAVYEAAGRGQWAKASRAAASAAAGWAEYRRSGDVPRRLQGPTAAVVERLTAATSARDRRKAQHAAVDTVQSALDLRLQYVSPTGIDRGRFDAWLRQLLVDASADSVAGAAGDVSALEWVRDRFAHTLSPEERTRLDTLLVELREAVRDEDLKAASELAVELRELV
jgi:hypothetical protein